MHGRASFWKRGKTAGAADRDTVSIHLVRPAESFANHGPKTLDVFDIGGNDQPEFVSAQARNDRPRIHVVQQPVTDGGQKAIPQCMAEGIIDWLESIEVQHADRQAGPTLLGVCKAAPKLTEKVASIGQSGQRVGMGESRVLRAEQFRLPLLRGDRSGCNY